MGDAALVALQQIRFAPIVGARGAIDEISQPRRIVCKHVVLCLLIVLEETKYGG
jgi:hypothetical protein